MKSFLAITLVACIIGMSQTQQTPAPTTPTLEKIQDGAKCLYGITGLFIDSLDLAQIYQTGGASLVSERVQSIFKQLLQLPEKFATDPQSAIFEAITLYSTLKSLKAEFFTYLPKCATFMSHFTQ